MNRLQVFVCIVCRSATGLNCSDAISKGGADQLNAAVVADRHLNL